MADKLLFVLFCTLNPCFTQPVSVLGNTLLLNSSSLLTFQFHLDMALANEKDCFKIILIGQERQIFQAENYIVRAEQLL